MKKIIAVFAFAFLSAGIATAEAQTMSYADAISQLASVCRNDLAQYCRGVPLGPRLKECFDANSPRMSGQCQQTRAAVYASMARRAAAQRAIGDICSADINRLCGTSHADNHLVECLAGVTPNAMSSPCYQAFIDTGWGTERTQQ